MILVAGGRADPNLAALLAAFERRGLPHRTALVSADAAPRLAWDLDRDRLELDGEELAPAAVFLRFDVFTPADAPPAREAARAWYYTVLAWALAHPAVLLPNRRLGAGHLPKPLVLQLARAHGLELPRTLVTSEPHRAAGQDPAAWITKPVAGGSHTRSLAGIDASETINAPVFVQERLQSPDLRIYRVGERWFGFALHSRALDYRTDRSVSIDQVRPPEEIRRQLAALTDALGLDFAAADLKLSPGTGRFQFLEVNSAPMFTAFDQIAGGALADAIVDLLVARMSAPARRTPHNARRSSKEERSALRDGI